MGSFLEFLRDNWGVYVDAAITMIQLSFVSFAIALVVGIFIASLRVSPVRPLQRFGSGFTQFFRNTPLLALLVLAFFGLPALNIVYSPFITGAVVLGMYTGAYMAETVRSGINSVDKGQAEAARAIGLPFRQVLSLVVLPQALRSVVPPMSNLFIANSKNASLTIAIGVTELTAVTRTLAERTGRAVEAVAVAALFYVVFLVAMQQLFNWLESRLEISR